MKLKVVDVSKWNGTINFGKVAKSGVYGVIIRAGHGTSEDPLFLSNYINAKNAGLRVGAYWYTNCVNAKEAATEVQAFLTAIKDKTFELPTYMDIEEQPQIALPDKEITAVVNTFCTALEKAGYYAGIYSMDSFYARKSMQQLQKRYTAWVAKWSENTPRYCTAFDMWQYTNDAKIDGINTDVDVSYIYKDFEKIIKSKQLNGFKKQQTNSENTQYTLKIETPIESETKARMLVSILKTYGITAQIQAL